MRCLVKPKILKATIHSRKWGGGEQSCPVGLDAFACPPNINRCTTCKIPKVAKMDRIQKGVSYASDQI